MLKNIKRGYVKEEPYYELVFDNGEGTDGYAFPCDGAGNVKSMGKPGYKSLEYCMAHPEKFSRYNEVIRQVRHIHVPTRGECVCGEKVELYDQYRGAFRCRCGRWYDAHDGHELVKPEYWHDDEY